MKNTKKKNIATLTALILIITIVSTTLTVLPLANAHDPPWTIPTYAYVAVSPPTIGVGQYTTIVMWVNVQPVTASGIGGDLWRGFTLNITKPDGTTQVLPYTGRTSQVASAFMSYTPDQVGDYSIVFSWPGQTLVNGTNPSMRMNEYVGDFHQGSTSEPAILHVQQEPIKEWAETPLPNDYWTRPIPTINRDWAQLASNFPKGSWLRYGKWQEQGQAPNSAHVLWTKSVMDGGIADERYGAIKLDTKDYEDFLPAPIVMEGKIYYNALTYPNYGYYCVDLRTGETQYYKNGTDNGMTPIVTINQMGNRKNYPELSFGQVYNYYGTNGAGVKHHLWMTQSGTPQTATSGGTMWHLLDPNTGNWVMSLKNVPGGTSATDQDGNLLLYSYNANTGNFLCWNVTQSIPPLGPTGTNQQQWEPPTGAVLDAVNDTTWQKFGPQPTGTELIWYADDILPRSGYTMNVTIAKNLPGSLRILRDAANVPKLIVMTSFPGTLGFPMASPVQYFDMAVVRIDDHAVPYSPFPDKSCTQNNNLGFGLTVLWNQRIPYPITTGNLTFNIGVVSYEDQVFNLWCKELRQSWGYDLNNGNKIWGPSAQAEQMDYYAQGQHSSTNDYYAYGKIFTAGFGGTLLATDIKTGKLLWNYTATNIGHESPYGNYPILTAAIADGKVYIVSGEHSATQPMWRGSYLRCINATDGTEIWKIQHYPIGNNNREFSIADGYIIAANEYDGQLWVIGKGPSATTVSAPQTVIALGQSVMVTGTVTDESAGTKNPSQKALFPNGVPAVSDSDQEKFMEYLYEQQVRPTTVTGVEVSLDTIDPNGNFIHIGKVTSDGSGMFKKMFTPEVPGEYSIIATFAGSESYGSSSAVSAIGVSEAPVTPAPEPVQAAPDNTMTILGTGIGIIIAVAIGFAVTILMLRKRP